MTSPPTQLDQWNRVLATYAGRDKAIRSLAFFFQLKAQDSPRKAQWLALAKQLSSARLVMRQLNHPSMMRACMQIKAGAGPADRIENACAATVTGVYSVYGVVELLAFLSDAKILSLDSARLYRWCLYLWIAALIAGIGRQIRAITLKSTEKAKQDWITLIGLASDFVSAVNSLPLKILWAGQLEQRTTASFSLLASLIGLYRVF